MQYDLNIIEQRPKPVHIEATITNFTKGGAAFARENGGMRDIFIPVAVVERMSLERGDFVIATTVPNRLYEEWSPELGVLRPAELFAIHIVKSDDDSIGAMQEASKQEQLIKAKTTQEKIMEVLEDGPARANDILDIIGGDEKVHTIFHMLNAMHAEGVVARASIYKKKSQVKASFVVWALDADELLPEPATEDEDDLLDL